MTVTVPSILSSSPPCPARPTSAWWTAWLSSPSPYRGRSARIAAAHDLSVVQARLLGILRDRRPAINELAGFLQLDKSSVTGLVDRAEARGLVERSPSPDDGRSVQVSITAAGRDLVDLATSAFENEIAGLVADVGPAQRRRLSAMATVIVATDARRRGIRTAGVEAAPARTANRASR